MKFRKFNKIILLFMVISMLFVSACDNVNNKYIEQATKEIGNQLSKETKKAINKASKEITKELTEQLKELGQNITIKYGKSIDTEDADINDYDNLKFTDYYTTNGEAKIGLDIPDAGEAVYGELDNLGRPTYVIANINNKMRNDANKRGRLPINLDPVGWYKNKEVEIKEKDGKTYNGYFYNRSHMLADSLGGLPIAENLITGTRTQNVGIANKGGMAYAEIKARKYLDNHKNVELIYQVKNVYFKNELIPRYTTIDMKSIDDKINEEIIVCNSANGYTIDYNTGKYHKK